MVVERVVVTKNRADWWCIFFLFCFDRVIIGISDLLAVLLLLTVNLLR